MSKIVKQLYPDVIARTADRSRQRAIRIPAFKHLRQPQTIPQSIRDQLKAVGLWDVNPLNLFRITWKNDIQSGGFGPVNFLEIPKAITGVEARIVGLVGKHFP